LVLKLIIWLDKFSRKRSNKVIVVGRDMVDTLNKRFHKKIPTYTHINNWIDEKSIYPLDQTEQHVARFREQYGLKGKYVVMYSGNLGLYYDLENLLHALGGLKSFVTSDGREVVFAFVGDGCLRNKMQQYVQERKMDNVVFIPYQTKDELLYSLNAADLHWCVSASGIKGVSVPSKIYGIMSCGKPVIGMMESGSEARMILEETGCGLACEPGDYDSVIRNLKWFVQNAESSEVKNMGMNGRSFLGKELTKDMSIRKYISEIGSC
jgi:glycosyltransferase involved in cell wall biosynthesis